AWRLQRAIKVRHYRQQNGKVEGSSAPKPLDNLNCVAPEKQMWFDASGRAYVSLATRYDPIRKSICIVTQTLRGSRGRRSWKFYEQ
ncbi:hypothetical protein DPMN_148692, partial [Dreissena polymorpha]